MAESDPSPTDEQGGLTLSDVLEQGDRDRRKWARALKAVGAVLLLAAVIVYWGAPVSVSPDFRWRLLLICGAAGFLGIALWLIGDEFQSSSGL